MIMALEAAREVEPIGGVEYRRWLAEHGTSTRVRTYGVVLTPEKAKRKRKPEKAPELEYVPDEHDIWGDTFASRIVGETQSPFWPAKCSAATLRDWPMREAAILADGGDPWETFVEGLAMKERRYGKRAAWDELVSLDAARLSATYNHEIDDRSEYGRSRFLRAIFAMTGEYPTDTGDMTVGEISDWLDLLSYLYTSYLVASGEYARRRPPDQIPACELCNRCNKNRKVEGELFCKDCRVDVKREMIDSGYLPDHRAMPVVAKRRMI